MLLISVSSEVYIFVATIAIVLFWPMWWLAAKFIRRTGVVLAASLLGSLAVASIIYVVLVMGMLASMYYYPSKTFTTESWVATGWKQEYGDNIPPTRYFYSEDLIERKLLIGMTREEVLGMLGEGFESADRVSYDLGFVPGHGVDPDFLEIYFENGVVVKVEQRRS